MKLSKSLIKKYGISKKAWSMQKQTKKGRINTMVKRKKSYSKNRSSGNGKSGITQLISAAAYGAARVPISNAAQPLMNKMPFGNYNHEVLFGGAALAAKMLIKNKMIQDIATPILLIETAAAAQQTTQEMTGGQTAAGIVYY